MADSACAHLVVAVKGRAAHEHGAVHAPPPPGGRATAPPFQWGVGWMLLLPLLKKLLEILPRPLLLLLAPLLKRGAAVRR